jgi:hypothetical protein
MGNALSAMLDHDDEYDAPPGIAKDRRIALDGVDREFKEHLLPRDGFRLLLQYFYCYPTLTARRTG